MKGMMSIMSGPAQPIDGEDFERTLRVLEAVAAFASNKDALTVISKELEKARGKITAHATTEAAKVQSLASDLKAKLDTREKALDEREQTVEAAAKAKLLAAEAREVEAAAAKADYESRVEKLKQLGVQVNSGALDNLAKREAALVEREAQLRKVIAS